MLSTAKTHLFLSALPVLVVVEAPSPTDLSLSESVETGNTSDPSAPLIRHHDNSLHDKTENIRAVLSGC